MIRSLIKLLLKFIYKILSVFHLQFALAVLLIGVVLYFTGVVDKYYAIKLVLVIALVISAVYAIFATLNSLLGGKKQKKKVNFYLKHMLTMGQGQKGLNITRQELY